MRRGSLFCLQGRYMFSWIKRILQDIKISSEFPAYEKKCRAAHLQAADNKFSTQDLLDSLVELKREISAEVRVEFDAALMHASKCQAESQTALLRSKQKLAIFQHNYKQEIDSLYVRKNSLFLEKGRYCKNKKGLYDDLKLAFDDRDAAYSLVNEAQSNVDSWYAEAERSGWLLGNKGKKIPNHAFFGQSHGDLDYYKSKRADAYSDVHSCQSIIADIKSEIEGIKLAISRADDELKKGKLTINQFKLDRQKMFDLKKRGYNLKNLTESVNRETTDFNEKAFALKLLEQKKESYVNERKQALGVFESESKINQLVLDKHSFISEFDCDAVRAHRKAAHRVLYLQN